MRRGLAVVDARHLAGEFLQIGGGVARDEHLGLVAMTRQGHIARRRSPVLRMIEVGLVEGAALALIDRTGVAVPKFLELRGVERDAPGRAAIELHVNGCVFDARDRAGITVDESALLIGADDLDSGRQSRRTPCRDWSRTRDPRPARRAPCARPEWRD